MENLSYYFAVCQVGAEPALKAEIARDHPELRFAYSRPGFVTFKWEPGKSAAAPNPRFFSASVFARAWGRSIRRLSQKKDASLADDDSLARVVADVAMERRARRLHVWQRDLFKPGEEPLGYDPREFAQPMESRIRALLPELEADPVAKPGDDPVIDLIWVDPGEWWLGEHACLPKGRSRYPGGRIPIRMPEEAPSRAYLKLEEAVIGSELPLREGDIAVEVGSSPGGASYALLKRGINVHGIDPFAMDKVVMVHSYPGSNPWFRFTQQPVGNVTREMLPQSVDWLLLDMNAAPRISLYEIDRMATLLKGGLQGLILTIKLNDWKLAEEIPAMLEHVRSLGMVEIMASQLPSNRQEFCVTALTPEGAKRLSNRR